MTNNFYFHQDVITPIGPGIVQGKSADNQILVSHRPDDIPADQRPQDAVVWVLRYYDPEQLKAKRS